MHNSFYVGRDSADYIFFETNSIVWNYRSALQESVSFAVLDDFNISIAQAYFLDADNALSL